MYSFVVELIRRVAFQLLRDVIDGFGVTPDSIQNRAIFDWRIFWNICVRRRAIGSQLGACWFAQSLHTRQKAR